MIEPIRALRLVIALVLMTLLLTSCRSSAADHALHGAHAPDPAVAAAGDFSIYDLDSEWTDQRGSALSFASLQGRPQVIALVYTHCAYACPRIVSDMKRIEGELRAAGSDAGFVLVSIDPERDTPERLAKFAAATRLDPADWTLLSGSDDAVLELAALLGVRYRRIGESDFEHSNVITLVAADGRIVHRQMGLGTDPAALVAAALH